MTPGISSLLSPLNSCRTCWAHWLSFWRRSKGKKNPKLPADSPPLSLTAVCWRHTSALSPLPSLLTFLSTSSDTEMRLEIELCIFHEVPNASAPAAPPRSGLCFALSIPNNFFFLFFFFLWFDCLFLSRQNKPGEINHASSWDSFSFQQSHVSP